MQETATISPASVGILLFVVVSGLALTLRQDRRSSHRNWQNSYSGMPLWGPEPSGPWRIWLGFALGIVFCVFMYVLFGVLFFEAILGLLDRIWQR